MHKIAEDLSLAERALGVDSKLVQCDNQAHWEMGADADVHVVHTHLPISVTGKIVYVIHGTPEHVFQTAVQDGLQQGYGASDPFMLAYHWMKVSDAIVTMWPRHQALWQQLCMRPKMVDLVPMGVDLAFWKKQDSRGKYSGTPSVFTAENCHAIKWPLDLIWMWPWVAEQVPEARLHLAYLPKDQHRWWAPLLYASDAAFKSIMTGNALSKEDLRNALNSVDYYASFVRYGDHNKICLEAKASGCKVISYTGNPYADFWIPEGDQRGIAKALVEILKGDIAPRECQIVDDREMMAKGMIAIYNRIC
jgi:hypothetical protein